MATMISEISLRPMTMEDADSMLKWKNYEETRKFAILTNAEIQREDHYRWLKNNLQYFQIIEHIEDGMASAIVGAIRIQDDEISIWIEKAVWSQGFAKNVINKVSYPGMIAKIVAGNIASLRAFISAGFLPTKFVDNKYYLLKKP